MSVPPEHTRPEAEIATPPRGVDTSQQHTAEEPARVWGEPHLPAPRANRRSAYVQAVWAVALVVGLVGTAWISTEHFREVWPGAEPREPAAVRADGSATLAGITVSLVDATDLGATPSLGDSDWQPPAGFHAWRVVLETSSVNEDLVTCDVAVVDARGRQFRANYFVDSFVDGYEWSYTCGVIEPDDDIGPQQALLVLVPEDADVRTVRIWHSTLNPDFIELQI